MLRATLGLAAVAHGTHWQRHGSRRVRLVAAHRCASEQPCTTALPAARSYTPAVLPVYVNASVYAATAPLTSCADARLTAAEAVACLTCLSLRDRRRCLAQARSG